MPRRRYGVVVGLIVVLGGPAVAAGPEAKEAEGLVAKLRTALGAIGSVQGTYRTYFSSRTPGTGSIEPDGHPVPGAIDGPDGLVLYSEFAWSWQARPYREAIDGKWGFIRDNLMHYSRATFFFDGAVLRTLSRDDNSGLIKPLDGTFTVWRNPLYLAGIGFGFEPRRNLDALLAGARLVALPDTPPHLKVLRSEFRENGQDYELTAWIDTTHGYLPRRIEMLEKDRRFVTRRIVNDEIAEVAPGVWLVLDGSETNFYVDRFILPDGMTIERLKTLDREAIARVRSETKAISAPLGWGTQTYRLDASTFRLNQAIARDRFVLKYPAGASLVDTTRDPPVRYRVKLD